MITSVLQVYDHDHYVLLADALTLRPPLVKLPTKITFFAVWLMSMNPPQPGVRGGKYDTFTLPSSST